MTPGGFGMASGPVPLSVVGDLLAPFERLVGDVVSLDPVLVQLLVFGVLLGAIYALIALGLTIIFGVMDVVNFAHGAFVMVAMYVVWYASGTLGVNPFLVIPLGVVFLFVLGVVVHVLTIEPILEAPERNQFIVTFGVLLVIESLVSIIFSPDPRALDLSLGVLAVAGVRIPVGQLLALLAAIGAIGLLWALLYRTDVGRAIRGTAEFRDGARYVGINVFRIDYITFGLGSALAGLAGSVLVLYHNFYPSLGHNYIITAFVIVVLGGLGSLRGAFAGAMIIGLVEVFGGFYFPGSTYKVLIFLVFIAFLLLKPEGLFGGADHGA